MPGVDVEQVTAAFKERVGKPKSLPEACLVRRQNMGLRAASKNIRTSYSTIRGWPMRVKDADLKRRFDKKHPGQKTQLDERVTHAMTLWLDNPPNLHGFQAGAWSLDMVIGVVKRRFGMEYKERTTGRIPDFLGYSWRKPRPMPKKSATTGKQYLMRETNELMRILQ